MDDYNKGTESASEGKWGEALCFYNRALMIQREDLGDSHLLCARTLNQMAVALAYSGDVEMAKAAMEEALVILHESGIDEGKVAAAWKVFRDICDRKEKRKQVKRTQHNTTSTMRREKTIIEIAKESCEAQSNNTHQFNPLPKSKTMIEIVRESCEEESNSTSNLPNLRKIMSDGIEATMRKRERKFDGRMASNKSKEVLTEYDQEQFLRLQHETRKCGIVTNAGAKLIAASLSDGFSAHDNTKKINQSNQSICSKSSRVSRQMPHRSSFHESLNASLREELSAAASG